MHGQEETSLIPRAVCTVIDGALLGIAAWLLLGGGGQRITEWLGIDGAAIPTARAAILLAFGAVLFLRMLITQFHLIRRKFGWEELGGVVFALVLYQIGFALLALTASAPLGALDAVAVVLYLLGAFLNTGSEFQRKRFKDDPANKGRLYTEGLFRYARHINYFGDILWVTAWALVTRNPWSATIPIALTAGFIFFFIPSLSAYLEERYGEEYQAWRRSTKALIPFVY